ncbi:hypothetical protein, partial [uncultured Amaricoccus sp.]|uniref:hypothetical protein n=1 Tax=uncultured Amaricoccus sp. TaxID=339341 RepID=UPI002615EBA4
MARISPSAPAGWGMIRRFRRIREWRVARDWNGGEMGGMEGVWKAAGKRIATILVGNGGSGGEEPLDEP